MKIAIDKRIFSNSAWMILEKFIGVFGLIFVNSYMAKYIGPENFGKLAFTTSIFVFVQTLSWFGSQNILFKRFSENLKSGVLLAASTQLMRNIIYVVASILAMIYLWFSSDTLTLIFGFGNCIASYFIINDYFSIHNNSQLMSVINALTNILGLVFALILRFFLVYFEADAYTMIFPIIVMVLIPYFLRKYYFNKKFKNIIFNINKKRYVKYLFLTGGSLVLSTISIVLYTQISNIFLAKLTSFESLGIYNVALTLGVSWGFINAALISSYFSRIYAESDSALELKYLKQIHWLVIFIAIFVMMGVLFLGGWMVNSLYGPEYYSAAKILPLIVLGATFSALGTINYRYIIKYSGYSYLSIKMLIVSLLSIPLSYFFISYYGVTGAALCFAIVELISLTIANYFFREKSILKLHLKIIGFSNV